MGGYSAVVGSEPERFSFNDKTASVPATENTAQMVVNHFKNYLQRTNGLYSMNLRAQAAQEEEQRRRELQEGIQRQTRELETRQRVKSQLKW